MRRRFLITSVLAGGIVAAALVATPALAANGVGPWSGDCPNGSTATSQNAGPSAMGNGSGMMGNGGGRMGRGQGLSNLPTGTLTAAQKADLVSMVEEEKLAHDVYLALGAKYPELWQFSRIVNAETMHQTALRSLLTRYAIADPTAGLAAGTFANDRFQTLYDNLTSGATTAEKALAAGIAVEKADIADLTSALNGLTAPDVTRVYSNLRNASQHHLAAFGG